MRVASSIVASVKERLRTFGAEREPIVVGVSGGADSVGLLKLLLEDAETAPLPIIAHLDHGLRDESAHDAAWVCALARTIDPQQRKLAVVVERIDVREFASEMKLGIEESARRCRYDFLARVARKRGCRFVAVAHTADDQAETILHHLLRGTGLAGLRGIPASRALNADCTLIRPVLHLRRSQLVESLGDQPFLSDETNADETFTRNWLRQRLLPSVREHINPQVTDALLRLSEQAANAQTIVTSLAERLLEEAVIFRHPDRVTLDVQPLIDSERHLICETFRLLWTQQSWPRGRMGYDDWTQLADLAQPARSGKSLTLPQGMTATHRRGQLVLERHRA